MAEAAARMAHDDRIDRDLFAGIGKFLSDQQLPPSPDNYTFAHKLLADPGGPLARVVAGLTDGGVRLTDADVTALTHQQHDKPVGDDDALADRAEHQLQDFVGLMTRMRRETSGFGRDLAATVGEMDGAGGDAILRLAATMLARVRTAESRLEQANAEAEALRGQLEAARGDARCDTLTGLPNRRALLEDFAVSAASGRQLFLAICDVDHFKRINDRFGHPVGDRVLRAIGSALAETCGGAFVTRYGGEEFAVLFRGGTLDAALEVMERARAFVAAKRYKMRADDTPLGSVTFSAGLVSVTFGEGFETAFDRADALLYAAKTDGRNQVRS